jgi:hypothetical protein
MSMKNSSEAFEPATFWFVAQYLNKLRHRGPYQRQQTLQQTKLLQLHGLNTANKVK